MRTDVDEWGSVLRGTEVMDHHGVPWTVRYINRNRVRLVHADGRSVTMPRPPARRDVTIVIRERPDDAPVRKHRDSPTPAGGIVPAFAPPRSRALQAPKIHLTWAHGLYVNDMTSITELREAHDWAHAHGGQDSWPHTHQEA